MVQNISDQRQFLYNESGKYEQPQTTSASPAPNTSAAGLPSGKVSHFLVKISNLLFLRDHIANTIKQKFPDCSVEPLLLWEEKMPLGDYLVVTFSNPVAPWEIASQIESVDGVIEAEPDLPRYTSIIGTVDPASNIKNGSEMLPKTTDGKSNWNETEFLREWAGSPYFTGLDPSNAEGLSRIRKWNHAAIKYSAEKIEELLKNDNSLEVLKNIRIAHLDTGYSDHSKVKDGFNTELDFDTVDDDADARDEINTGLGKLSGHGTRTGSILIGNQKSNVPTGHEGNVGLLRNIGGSDELPVKLIPFRIANSVIYLKGIKNLIQAASKAIDSGFQVFSLSMGILPGSTASADLARTAYERGVIWCCAAGNNVGIVVAPGKYPGVICVAASNPLNKPWEGSCSGPEVDITAPGQGIYVPILTDENQEDMNYGTGTSYAVPHVAAAAVLWLAKNNRAIASKYTEPWQKVEAFRFCLQRSASKLDTLPTGKYGAGLLNIEALLKEPLPEITQLRHAYLTRTGLEKTSAKFPVALRELIYNDCKTVMQGLLQKSDTVQHFPEPTSGLAFPKSAVQPLSIPAQQIARIIEKEARIWEPIASVSNAEAATMPEAAFARLLALQEGQKITKPFYENLAEDPASGKEIFKTVTSG